MDQFVLDIFINEITTQCEFAQIAIADLRTALHTRNTKRAFYSAYAFLIHVANLSKIFWPKGKYRDRGSELRRLLHVPVNSSIKVREFRNHYEHYDERLEEWATRSKRKNIVDMSIMPSGAIAGIDPDDFMRNLDPTNLNLTFHGDRYDLLETESAVNDILNQARILQTTRQARHRSTIP